MELSEFLREIDEIEVVVQLYFLNFPLKSAIRIAKNLKIDSEENSKYCKLGGEA